MPKIQAVSNGKLLFNEPEVIQWLTWQRENVQKKIQKILGAKNA